MSELKIKTFYFNPYRECTYVVWREGEKECLLIDAGMSNSREEERLSTFLTETALVPTALLITHTHPDHVCGVDFIEKLYGLKPIVYPAVDKRWINGYQVEVLRTPGHKEDSVCYYLPAEQCLFTGDTLFLESIGRTDLPGGDTATLLHSLQQLLTLPDDTAVYPGHGYPTTIGHEKAYNPFIRLGQ